MLRAVTTALLDALATVLPIDCAGCGRPDRALCDDCRAAITPLVTPRSVEGRLTVYTSLRYEGVTRQTLLALKESGRTDVAKHLAASLAPAISRALASGAEVVPVPTSRAAWKRRGYDHVAILTRRAGFSTARVLVSGKHGAGRKAAQQKSLGVDQRAANLRHTMVATGPLHGRRFVLVDDVLTSGATLVEAARAITTAGGEVVGAAALAFTPRLFGAASPSHTRLR